MGGVTAVTVMEAILEYSFMQRALAAALLSGILCGLIGVIVVEKRMVMMSGGIAHTAYGGVGLGYLAGFSPLLGAVLFSLAAAFGIGSLRHRRGARVEVLISLFWSFGMAAGIVFVALAPGGYPAELNSYLFGNILTVERLDLLLMLGATLLALFLFFLFYQDFKAYLFDETFAGISGLATGALSYLLFGLIALSVVVLLRVTGIMLTIALLTAPAATAALLSRRLLPRILLAAVLSSVFSIVGLVLSFYLNIPSGAVIVAVAILTYVIALSLHAYLLRRRKKQGS